jgi:hypothetical protein
LIKSSTNCFIFFPSLVHVRDVHGGAVAVLFFKNHRAADAPWELLQKYYRGGGSFVFEDIVKLHGFAQNLSFCKCNTQKRGGSDGFKLTELI